MRPELAAALAEERWGAGGADPNPAQSRPYAAAERAARLARLAQPRTALWELCACPPPSSKVTTFCLHPRVSSGGPRQTGLLGARACNVMAVKLACIALQPRCKVQSWPSESALYQSTAERWLQPLK